MIVVFILVGVFFLIALNWTWNSVQWKHDIPSEPSYQPHSEIESDEESDFREEYQFI